MEKSEHHSVASARLQGLERSWTSITVGRWGLQCLEQRGICMLICLHMNQAPEVSPPMIHSDEDGVTLKILFMRKEEAHLNFL